MRKVSLISLISLSLSLSFCGALGKNAKRRNVSLCVGVGVGPERATAPQKTSRDDLDNLRSFELQKNTPLYRQTSR